MPASQPAPAEQSSPGLTNYCVWLAARSALKLNGNLPFTLRDGSALVMDAQRQVDGGRIIEHMGLFFRCDVRASDLLEGVRRAKSMALHISDELSAASCAAIADAELTLAYGSARGRQDRPALLPVRNSPSVRRPRRDFDEPRFREFIRRLGSYRQADGSKGRRVMRALHCLRKSMLEADVVDSFEDLWRGLEAMNPLIREKFGLATTEALICPRCKRVVACECGERQTRAADWLGIAHSIEKLAGHPAATARLLRNRRIDIVHARADVMDSIAGLDQLVIIARRSLLAGIAEELGIPQELRNDYLRDLLPIDEQPEFLVEGQLNESDVAELDSTKQLPRLRLLALEVLSTPPIGSNSIEGVRAIQLVVEMLNYAGRWTASRVYPRLPSGPEAADAAPDILVKVIDGSPPVGSVPGSTGQSG